MPISIGENIIANDFINESEIPTPQSDAEGKVVKLEDDGKIDGKFLRPRKVEIFTPTKKGLRSTNYNITNPSGTTFRYTYSSGTDPDITSATVPVNSLIEIHSSSNQMNANNVGVFTVTNSGTNFFEITNASGVAETSKSAFIYVGMITLYTVPENVVSLQVEFQASGSLSGDASSSSTNSRATGGGAGGYSKKFISSPSATYSITATGDGYSFGGIISVGIGKRGASLFSTSSTVAGGEGGSATGGDINIDGQDGHGAIGGSGLNTAYFQGGNSALGSCRVRATSGNGDGYDGTGFGAGGSAPKSINLGGDPSSSALIITEFY